MFTAICSFFFLICKTNFMVKMNKMLLAVIQNGWLCTILPDNSQLCSRSLSLIISSHFIGQDLYRFIVHTNRFRCLAFVSYRAVRGLEVHTRAWTQEERLDRQPDQTRTELRRELLPNQVGDARRTTELWTETHTHLIILRWNSDKHVSTTLANLCCTSLQLRAILQQ